MRGRRANPHKAAKDRKWVARLHGTCKGLRKRMLARAAALKEQKEEEKRYG